MANYQPSIDGDTLRQVRSKQLLTQKDLALKAGVRVETICRLELGKRPARFATIVRLATALGVEPEALTRPIPVWNTIKAETSTLSIGGER